MGWKTPGSSDQDEVQQPSFFLLGSLCNAYLQGLCCNVLYSVKQAHCWRMARQVRPDFSSQYSDGGSQLPAALLPGDPILLLGLPGHQAHTRHTHGTHTVMQVKHTHKIKK